MTTRNILYSKFLDAWSSKLCSDGQLNTAQKEGILEDLGVDDLQGAILKIRNVISNQLFLLILDRLSRSIENDEALDEEIPTSLYFNKEEVVEHRTYCFKPLTYASTDGKLYVMTSSFVKKISGSGTIADDAWKILELMIMHDVTSIDFIDNLLVESTNDKKYVYILTDQANPNVWRLYSFAYLCKINRERVDIPKVLEYSSSIHFSNTDILFKQDVLYEQFFEAYHVMNESKYVEDILGRFLRMYQVLELFVYRQLLVSIENENSKNNAFIRNVIKEAYKMGGDEKKQFVEGINRDSREMLKNS